MIPTPPKPRYAPGTRVRVTQEVRVGHRRWTTSVEGRVEAEGIRPVGGMEMGAKASYCLQPTLRLRGADGTITVVSIDADSQVEELSPGPAGPEGA
ncbi:MAG: hypothetical protein U0790_27150 [Isosphaeraceae bacterium]